MYFVNVICAAASSEVLRENGSKPLFLHNQSYVFSGITFCPLMADTEEYKLDLPGDTPDENDEQTDEIYKE